MGLDDNINPKKVNSEEEKLLQDARQFVDKLKDVIDSKNSGYSKMDERERAFFTEKLTDFAKDRFSLQEEKERTEKKVNEYLDQFYRDKGGSNRLSYTEGKGVLDEELIDNEENGAQPKKYASRLTYLAIAGIAVFGLLLAMAGVCATGFCGVQTQTILQADGSVITNSISSNVPLEIIESQFMLAMIGGVIAPIVMRVLKEKYDVQIEASQISMVMSDAVQAVKLYQNEADKLRDKNGRISQEYQAKLRDLAFDSMKTNYTNEKYESLVSSIGTQVFDKSIEQAVKNNWIERYPIERKQVEEQIKQSIDAVPQIVEWKNLDEEVKKSFLDGHVKRLLANAKLDGWAYDQLNEIFEAEVSKRLLAAALVDGKAVLKNIDSKGSSRYLVYTSTVAEAAIQSLSKN